MKKSIDILKSWFQAGDKPTESQFADLIDSFHHKDSGKLIASWTITNGNIVFTLTGGETVTIEKFALPNTMPLSFIDGLVTALNSKVSKQGGKDLSDENFTQALKQKLESLQNYVHPDKHAISEVNGLQAALDTRVEKVAGKELSDENFTPQLKQKLEGLENYVPPASKPISYIAGLQDNLNQLSQDMTQKVAKEDGKGLSSNDYSDGQKQKVAESETHRLNTDVHVSTVQRSNWDEKNIPYVQGTTYKSRATVIKDAQIWRINNTVVLPFESTDFAAERLAGKWDLITASFPSVVVKSMSVTSIAPNTTLDIIFKGSYFTPDTFVTIQNITVNNNVFIDDNTFKVNVTTAANAQLANNLDITINNGIAKVIPQKIAISLGTTYIPDVEGMAKFVLDASATGKVVPFSGGIRNEFESNTYKIAHVDFIIKGDFEMSFKHTLNNNGENRVGYLGLAEKTKTITTQAQMDYWFQFGYNFTWYYNGTTSTNETIANAYTYTFKIKRVGKDVQFLRNDSIRRTVNLQDETKELKLWFLFNSKTTVEDIKITLF